jgi:hypothetical protein
MDATRATLLAVAIAMAGAVPASAQPAFGEPVSAPVGYPAPQPSTAADGPVNMLPPQPLNMPALPLFPNRPVGSQVAEPLPPGQTAWLSPGAGDAGGANAGTGTEWAQSGRGQANPWSNAGRGSSAPAPTALAWRWHGYGAPTPGPIAPPPTGTVPPMTSSSGFSPYRWPQAYDTPLPPPQPQPPSVTPLPPPTPLAPGAPGPQMLAPAPVPDWPPTPTLPSAAAPPGFSTAIEPEWRSAGIHMAAAPMNPPPTAEPWVAASSRTGGAPQPQIMAYGWPNPNAALAGPRPVNGTVTTRAVSDAIPSPARGTIPSGVQQASYSTAASAGAAARHAANQPTHGNRTAAPVQLAAPTPAPRPVTNAPPPTTYSPGTAFSHLRTSIERACAGKGRELEVYAGGQTNLLVRVRVAKAADAEYLANKISQIPELAPYQISFEMRVAP